MASLLGKIRHEFLWNGEDSLREKLFPSAPNVQAPV